MPGKRMYAHDYTRVGFYMITMVTHDRRRLFGKCRDNQAFLSAEGEVVRRRWFGIPDHRPQVEASTMVVMPDHLHGILYVKEELAKPLGNTIRGFASGVTSELRKLSGNSSHDVWEGGYHDCVKMSPDTLRARRNYILDNPRRYCLRKANPDLFVRVNKLHHQRLPEQRQWAGFGNLFLIEKPDLIPVQVSRRATQEEINAVKHQVAERLESGAVAVSPFISQGEKEAAQMVTDREDGALILVKPAGFPPMYKPSGRYFGLCAQGRLLVLTAFEHTGRKDPLTRERCLEMNDWVRKICQVR